MSKHENIAKDVIDSFIGHGDTEKFIRAMYEHKDLTLNDLQKIDYIIFELEMIGLIKKGDKNE